MTLPEALDPESIVQRIQSGEAAAVAAELHVQRPADVAEILMEIPDAAEVEVLTQLSAGDIGSVLEFLIREEESVLEPFAQLSRENLSAILNRTPLGTAARVLRGLAGRVSAPNSWRPWRTGRLLKRCWRRTGRRRGRLSRQIS